MPALWVRVLHQNTANSATFPAQQQVPSRSKCSYIQMKNHSVATSVNLLSKRVLTLNGIYRHIQGRSNSSVISATIHTTELVISREKPFVCKQCNFTCKHLSSLRTHMFSHTGKEPYACKKCNYSCKQSGHLKRHMEKFHTT